MAYWCYTCLGPRSQCEPGSEPGACAVNERIAAEAPPSKAMPFIYMEGGTTTLAGQMDHTRSFDKGMDRYREARRHGEQPDSTTVEGVERARRRQDKMAQGLEGYSGT